jgi:hypothetical protein
MSHAADLPLDNASTLKRGPSIFAMAVAGIFALVLWLVVAFQVFFVVPKFEKTFLEFKMKLPLMTEWVIRDLWWFASACLIASILFCVIPRSRWAALIVLVALPLVLNLLIIASLYFPHAALMEGLGAHAPKN